MEIHKYRIVHDYGYVEFLIEADAINYRNTHYPNASIIEIIEEIQETNLE